MRKHYLLLLFTIFVLSLFTGCYVEVAPEGYYAPSPHRSYHTPHSRGYAQRYRSPYSY